MQTNLEDCNCQTEFDELEAQIRAAGPETSPDGNGPTYDTEQHATAIGAAKISQWAEIAEGVYRASGKTLPEIKPGVYTFGFDPQGNLLVLATKIVTDDLIVLPDTASETVLTSISHFWNCELKFKERGQVYKRGIMLWGPPGSGKTATIMLLTKDIMRRNGIVVYTQRPEVAITGLKTIRQVEPKRPIICVLEDVDEIVKRYGEHELLSLLDGEMQIDNVVFLATTNYPENIATRIINRPSRFDEVIKIGMPSPEARKQYLRSRMTVADLSEEQLQTWVDDTKDFSIAHLKELMVCVYCLGRDYVETLNRLKSMSRALSSGSENRTPGFR